MLRLKTQASERFPFPKIPTFGKSSGIRSGFSYKRVIFTSCLSRCRAALLEINDYFVTLLREIHQKANPHHLHHLLLQENRARTHFTVL